MVVQQFKSILFSFLIIIGFMASESHAIFRAMYWWVSPEGNNLFCLDENHTPCEVPVVVTHQRIALSDEAKKLNAYVIAEDMGRYAGNDSFMQGWTHNVILKFHQDRSALVGLIDACVKNKVRYSNVEFRQPIQIVDTLLLMQRVGADLKNCPQPKDVAHRYTLDFFSNIENKIRDYKKTDVDWPHLCGDRGYYAQVLKNHAEHVRAGGAASSQKKMKEDVSNVLCALGSELLDAEMVHQVYMHRYEPNIIIAAGGVHIDNIHSVLPQLGYTKKVMPSWSKIPCEYSGNGDTRRIRVPSAIDINQCFTWIEDAQKSAYRWHIAKKALMVGVAAIAAWCLYSWLKA